MKKLFFLIILIIVCLSVQPLLAEDTIKILIIESPDIPLPTDKAVKIGQLNGEILIAENSYKGYIEVYKDENGLHYINERPFEKYIAGVVAAETGDSWAVEALKAQAVISRTYAVYHKRLNEGNNYHITSSVLHQVYKGDSTDEIISSAVEETRGELLTYDGAPIEAFYHATCKGQTELPRAVWQKNYPYIKSTPCKGEDSPYDQWQRRFGLDEIQKALGLNSLKDLQIVSHTSTGRVKMLNAVTSDSEIEVRAVDLRRLLGYRDLPSTLFTLIIEGGNVIFEGGGYGHGVGLSQWGALELAIEGKNYKEILEHYYPGTNLTNCGFGNADCGMNRSKTKNPKSKIRK